MKYLILLIALIYYNFSISYAQPGKPDSLFGVKSIVTTNIGNPVTHNGSGRQVLLATDSSMYIIIATDGGTVVAKRHPDGSPDSSYGINSFSANIMTYDAHAVLQADGKILIAGKTLSENYYYEFRYYYSLARITTSGSLDLTFGENGKVITDIGGYYDAINSLTTDDSGQIVVCGFTSPYYIDDIDSNYNPLNPSGYVSIARYNGNGSPDYSFNGSGTLLTNIPVNNDSTNLVAIQNNKLIVVGSGYNGLSVVRFNPDGSVDNTFKVSNNLNQSGNITFIVKSLAIQVDGKIVVAGFWSVNNRDFVVARYDVNGKLDSTFSNDGIQVTDFRSYDDIVTSLSIQNDNKIVAGGYASNGSNYGFAIVRYNSNGSLDNSFDGDGKKMTYIGAKDIYASSITIQNDKKIILAGNSNNNSLISLKMARYNSDGGADSSFNSKGTLTDSLKQGITLFTATTIQSDGKIVTAGYNWNGLNYDFALARYTSDGNLDNTFSLDGKQTTDFGSNEFAQAVAIQSDGKIIVGGTGIARYNSDGTPDLTFNNTGHLTSPFDISFIKLQADGKIIAAGGEKVARYNSNGTLDATFSENGILTVDFSDDYFYNAIAAIVVQKDGKILLTGNRGFKIFRYNIDGSFDGSSDNGKFQEINFFPDWVDDGGYDFPYQSANSLNIQNDGKIVIGGHAGFTGRYDFRFDAAIARYNIDGTLDSTFGGRGTRIIQFNNYSIDVLVAIQTDEKIVVKGSLYRGEGRDYDDALIPLGYGFARLNNNGSIDSSFGADGLVYPQIDNKITDLTIGSNKLYITGFGTSLSEFGYLTSYLLTSDNKAPSVNLINPANNAIYTAPAIITLDAAASDEDGTVAYVRFYNGATLLKVDSTGPFSFTTNNLAAGTYSFVAKATDNRGLVSNSATVAVYVSAAVNQAPVISISSPANNSTYPLFSAITVQATASDPDGTINSVKFYNGATLLKTDSTSPYTCSISNASAGSYKFYAKATDNNGQTNSSSTVSMFLANGVSNKAPVVSITNPVNNAVFNAPATITINATANDPDGAIASVQFYNGSTLVETANTSPYSLTINNLAEGVYSFVVKAIDNSGLVSNSATVAVPVLAHSNYAPVVQLTSPGNNEAYLSPATISLNATANDPDGTITNVKFYNGGILLKTVSTAPYSYTIINAAPGNYKFYAKATDNNGSSNSTSTAYVTVTAQEANIARSFKKRNKLNPVKSDSDKFGTFSIILAPNPARNILNIYTKGLQSNKQTILSIVSSSGATIKTMQIAGSTQTIQLNVSSLSSGTHIIKIINGNKAISRQFIKF